MSESAAATQSAELAVIGAGPGGYPAAFRAAEQGMQVVLIDRRPNPGGVCLFCGCIPSKALLHTAAALQTARAAEAFGIRFEPPTIDLARLRGWKTGVVDKLTAGLGARCRELGVTYLQGEAQFTSNRTLTVKPPDGPEVTVTFEHAILATGSEPVRLPMLPSSPRILDSTTALELADVPGRLLVIGGGYIGLELGQAYAGLGTRVSVVELQSTLLPGVDAQLVQPLSRQLRNQFAEILTNTRVVSTEEQADGLHVVLADAAGQQVTRTYDKVLVAVGRKPATTGLGLERTAVQIGADGFVRVDARAFTAEPTIQAVGDVAGQPMLAHKATHEGRTAAAALRAAHASYDPRAIPAVVFTDPEVAWCGQTEAEARRAGLDVRIGLFPWQGSGRAATLNRPDGVTKIVAEAASGRVLGIGVSGHGAAELIAEGVLAIEMGAVAEDLALTVHAHPSLSETLMEAAQALIDGSLPGAGG